MFLFAITTYAQDLSGNWSGIIESGKSEAAVFNFTFEKSGEEYSTIIDIPVMRVANLKPNGSKKIQLPTFARFKQV